jgi:pyruvate formate lyase activating enzyme
VYFFQKPEKAIDKLCTTVYYYSVLYTTGRLPYAENRVRFFGHILCHRLDTAGSVPLNDNMQLVADTDLFILDIKHSNTEKYHELTGGDLNITLSNAKLLSDSGKKMWIRYVLVPGITDDIEDIKKEAEIIAELNGVEKVVVLPYSTLGREKWKKLNYTYQLENVEPPTKELIEMTKKIFRDAGLPVSSGNS